MGTRDCKVNEIQKAYNWLCQQHDDLGFGLLNPIDGIRLYQHFNSNKELPDYCDTPDMASERIKCLGYDPMVSEDSAIEWNRWAEKLKLYANRSVMDWIQSNEDEE